jgi:hypothetical protein
LAVVWEVRKCARIIMMRRGKLGMDSKLCEKTNFRIELLNQKIQDTE